MWVERRGDPARQVAVFPPTSAACGALNVARNYANCPVGSACRGPVSHHLEAPRTTRVSAYHFVACAIVSVAELAAWHALERSSLEAPDQQPVIVVTFAS